MEIEEEKFNGNNPCRERSGRVFGVIQKNEKMK